MNTISDIEKAVLLRGEPALLSDKVVVMPKEIYEKIREERLDNELRKSLIEARSLSDDRWLDWNVVADEIESEFFTDV